MGKSFVPFINEEEIKVCYRAKKLSGYKYKHYGNKSRCRRPNGEPPAFYRGHRHMSRRRQTMKKAVGTGKFVPTVAIGTKKGRRHRLGQAVGTGVL
jgi:hypothetical protein